jgi:hypothetical protein
MALITCGGCESVHESALAVCPVCGRCPGRGGRRAPHISKADDCPNCQAPFCSGYGRCHVCGSTRSTDLLPCTCGHRIDLERLAQTEASFALPKRRDTDGVTTRSLVVGLTPIVMSLLIVLLIVACFCWKSLF